MNNLKKLRIVFFGTPDFAIPVLEELNGKFTLAGVVTTEDKPAGRNRILTESPVAKRAEELEVTVYKVNKFDDLLAEGLNNLHPDLFVVASFGKIIPENILKLPKMGALNIHPSLLPKYRGASPIQSAILNADEVSGISIIKMDEKMDHGPIIYQEEFSLSDQDTFQSLHTKMFQRSAQALPKVLIEYVSGKTEQQAQDDTKASYCNPILKEDGYFNIDNPPSPKTLDRMIRAYFPWPTAWTKWESDSRKPKNEKIVRFLPGGYVQLEGKRAVLLKEFLNGYPDFPIKGL